MIQGRLQGAVGLSRLEFLLDLWRLFRQVDGGLFTLVSALLLETDLDSVMALVPVLEGMGVDQHDGPLDERLGTHQFVVGGVVRDIQHTDLAGTHFGTPGEVPGIETQGAKLLVATAGSHLVDPRFTDLGHGGGTTHLELALLTVLGTTASRLTTLVASFACDTHASFLCCCLLVVLLRFYRQGGDDDPITVDHQGGVRW